MAKSSKKGFFSLGKKKKSADEIAEPKEKKGFFSRFSRDKSPTSKQTQDPIPETDSRSPLPPTEPQPIQAEPSFDTPTQEETSFEHPITPETPVVEETVKTPKKPSFFAKLKSGLKKTRQSLSSKLGNLFLATKKIDEELLEELEELLIGSDIGVQTSLELIERVRREVDRKTLRNGEELKEHIKGELLSILQTTKQQGFNLTHNPTIILVVGVNGVGKTTTIGKVARRFQNDGHSVLMCAADTFRAAAVEQLEIWSKRAGVDIVTKSDSKDPAAVVFDALTQAKQRAIDVLLIDTAGRLHNNPNLMKELEKMSRIIGREFPNAPHHVLLILDAVTGQNGLQQAKSFVDKVGVTDLILTKLDGTAKGGIAIAITEELKLPIQFIGVGEQMDDLLPFNPQEFVHSLFEEDDLQTS